MNDNNTEASSQQVKSRTVNVAVFNLNPHFSIKDDTMPLKEAMDLLIIELYITYGDMHFEISRLSLYAHLC